jgi:hypothetical protein
MSWKDKLKDARIKFIHGEGANGGVYTSDIPGIVREAINEYAQFCKLNDAELGAGRAKGEKIYNLMLDINAFMESKKHEWDAANKE